MQEIYTGELEQQRMVHREWDVMRVIGKGIKWMKWVRCNSGQVERGVDWDSVKGQRVVMWSEAGVRRLSELAGISEPILTNSTEVKPVEAPVEAELVVPEVVTPPEPVLVPEPMNPIAAALEMVETEHVVEVVRWHRSDRFVTCRRGGGEEVVVKIAPRWRKDFRPCVRIVARCVGGGWEATGRIVK